MARLQSMAVMPFPASMADGGVRAAHHTSKGAQLGQPFCLVVGKLDLQAAQSLLPLQPIELFSPRLCQQSDRCAHKQSTMRAPLSW